MAKLKVMKTMMLVAAVAGILACFGGGSGVRAHAGDGEMLRLLKAVDLDENLVISEEEVAAWAAANGAVHVGPEQHSAPLSFAHEHVSALAHLLSSPILDGESYALQRATARRPLVGAIGSYSITPYPLTHTLAHTNTHTLAHTLAHTYTLAHILTHTLTDVCRLWRSSACRSLNDQSGTKRNWLPNKMRWSVRWSHSPMSLLFKGFKTLIGQHDFFLLGGGNAAQIAAAALSHARIPLPRSPFACFSCFADLFLRNCLPCTRLPPRMVQHLSSRLMMTRFSTFPGVCVFAYVCECQDACLVVLLTLCSEFNRHSVSRVS